MKQLLEKLVKIKETAAWWCKEFMWQKKLVKSQNENTSSEWNMIVDFASLPMQILSENCFQWLSIYLSISERMLPVLQWPAVNFFTR